MSLRWKLTVLRLPGSSVGLILTLTILPVRNERIARERKLELQSIGQLIGASSAAALVFDDSTEKNRCCKFFNSGNTFAWQRCTARMAASLPLADGFANASHGRTRSYSAHTARGRRNWPVHSDFGHYRARRFRGRNAMHAGRDGRLSDEADPPRDFAEKD
jgi:hypothetical protein